MEASTEVVFTINALMRQMLAFVQSDHHSGTTVVHSTAPAHTLVQLLLVAVGVIAVISTTAYTLWCFIRPEETEQSHIKRRILDEGRE
jgi:cytochrome bd-type quinol oxidase subunit 2